MSQHQSQRKVHQFCAFWKYTSDWLLLFSWKRLVEFSKTMWLVRVIAGVFTCPAWLPHLQFSQTRWSLAQPASSRHNYRLLIRPYVPFLNNVLTLDYLPRKERGTDDMVKQEQTRLIFSKNSSPNQLVHRSQFPSCTVDSGFQLTLITSEQNVAIQENQSTSIRRSQSWMMSLMMCVCVCTYIHT